MDLFRNPRNPAPRFDRFSGHPTVMRQPRPANRTFRRASVACHARRGVSCSHSGGRTWWAHVEFTRINIDVNYPPQKIEDHPHPLESARFLASCQPFAPQRHVLMVSGGRSRSQEISHRVSGVAGALGRAVAKGEGSASHRIGRAGDSQRRPFATDTTVNPSWRAASVSRSSNATKGSGWLISRCR